VNSIDIVVIGTILKESIYFANGRVVGPVIGSPVAYSSLVMAAQDIKVGVVTFYGDDMPDIIGELDVLDQRNVIPYAFTTTNRLIYQDNGDKYVEYIYRTPKIRYEDICEDYLKCKFFKICPMDYEVDLDLIKKLHADGKVVFVDLGGYGGATSDIRYSADTQYGKNVIETICNNCTIVKASAEDLASIFPGRTAEEAADNLVAMGAKTVVVTCGGKGAFYKIGATAPVYRKPYDAHSEEPHGQLDFTGAGDSFGAGFMASYVQHQDIDRAVKNGNATASLVIQRSGGCTFSRMPSKERIEKRLSGHL
jgi:sugar/nucleoside kinase (ribokinase family)